MYRWLSCNLKHAGVSIHIPGTGEGGRGGRSRGQSFTYRMLYSLKSAWTRWQCWYILRVAMISSAYRSGNLSSGISASFKRGDALIFPQSD